MTYEITADHENKMILVTAQGRITLDNVLDYIEQLMRKPFIKLPYGILVDYRNADLSQMTSEEVYQLIDYLKANEDKVGAIKIAILTAGELEFGLNRMFQLLSEEELPFEVHVTKEFEDAMHWAGKHPNTEWAAQG